MILLYLDPGSGSFLIQLLIAGLATARIALAIRWGRIKRLFTRNKLVDVDMTMMMNSPAYGGLFLVKTLVI
jgi:hypothetical protein